MGRSPSPHSNFKHAVAQYSFHCAAKSTWVASTTWCPAQMHPIGRAQDLGLRSSGHRATVFTRPSNRRCPPPFVSISLLVWAITVLPLIARGRPRDPVLHGEPRRTQGFLACVWTLDHLVHASGECCLAEAGPYTQPPISARRSWPCRGGCVLACVRWTRSRAVLGRLKRRTADCLPALEKKLCTSKKAFFLSLSYRCSLAISSLDGNHLFTIKYVLFAPTSGMRTSEIAWFLREKDNHNLFQKMNQDTEHTWHKKKLKTLRTLF
jgi:hypothetical protein